jgi:hypothetical protein
LSIEIEREKWTLLDWLLGDSEKEFSVILRRKRKVAAGE